MIGITANLFIGREGDNIIIGINDVALGGVVTQITALQAKVAARALITLAEQPEAEAPAEKEAA